MSLSLCSLVKPLTARCRNVLSPFCVMPLKTHSVTKSTMVVRDQIILVTPCARSTSDTAVKKPTLHESRLEAHSRA